ncbi:MAG TPA: glucosamine-6-phosphate deaminase [Acidimicrobiia bacterium]|jgi:glucosamine-6-phosphate deaminase|nr:glucosamine-6-phosphate deaminase [Acidimicrobiia bacterium]
MSRDFTADELSVRVFDDVQTLAAAAAMDAAEAIRSAIDDRGAANIMLATGNSQLVFLAALIEHREVDWSRVTAFHMDEYVDLPPTHTASFQRYMREKVAAMIPVKEFHYLNGDTGDAQNEADRYAALLGSHPLDLCVCGIGENGHLAFNDPPVADFHDPADVKIVALEPASRRQQVAEGHFATIDDVPTHAITVTIPALVRAHRVLAIVPEARKAVPVRDALRGPIATSCPASLLRRQPHATLYLDADSASLLDQ